MGQQEGIFNPGLYANTSCLSTSSVLQSGSPGPCYSNDEDDDSSLSGGGSTTKSASVTTSSDDDSRHKDEDDDDNGTLFIFLAMVLCCCFFALVLFGVTMYLVVFSGRDSENTDQQQ